MIVTRITKVKRERPPKKVRTKRCKTWEELTAAFSALSAEGSFHPEETSRWIFRGHTEAGWELECSLRRKFWSKCDAWSRSYFDGGPSVLKRIEGQLVFDFASKAKLHGLDVSVESPVSLLSSMQHFKTPTRLLDWTHSPHVAAYFAMEGTGCEDDHAAIWAVNLTALHKAATLKVLPIETLPNGTKVRPAIRVVDFSDDKIFRRHVMPDFNEYHRTFLFGEPTIELVVPILPGAQNERLSAQQGLFLCASQLGPPFLDQLRSLMKGVKEEWIVKLEIPKTLRVEILRRLFQMNVHPLSLFPGADGLGTFCSQKAELWGWE